MFKPIKDFITFIQKNTSINCAEDEIGVESNTMADITTRGDTASTKEKFSSHKTEEINCSSADQPSSLTKIGSTPENKQCKTIFVGSSVLPKKPFGIQIEDKIVSARTTPFETEFQITESNVQTIKNCFVSELGGDFDEDDIELQIKSSIMLKKNPLLQSSTPSPTPTSSSISSVTSSPCTTMTLTETCSRSFMADFNQNLKHKTFRCSPEDDDELGDFKNDPLQACTEDFHSVHSEIEESTVHSGDDTLEGEILSDTYPEDPGKREIYVVIENDLNSSISSSNTEDPLAIDISTLPISGDETRNPLDSSTIEENGGASSNEGHNWFDCEEKSATMVSTTTLPVDIRMTPVRTVGEANVAMSDARACNSVNVSRNEDPSEEMERCDNSDSGLGTETSSLLLQTTINNSTIESSNYQDHQTIVDPIVKDNIPTVAMSSTTITLPDTPAPLSKPLRSNLKRRYCDETDIETDNLPCGNSIKNHEIYPSKKPKRSINFDAVQVYYFPRQQGFGCVPSAGGCTLGMGTQHIDFKRLTLAEHAAELRRAHRLQLQEVNPRGSSSEETDESEEDYLSEGSGSDLDADSNGFLQPVPPKQRRAMLKAAGVRKIDTSEKIECRNIRNSREVCGCTCRDFCDPETCSCSQAGIKCQVDRAMFPCGCSRDACGNTTGRVEFNPARVRTHFIHTIMRLDMENRQQQQPMTLSEVRSCSFESAVTTSSQMPNGTTSNGFYNTQPQSNYSSGYASPAYTNEHNANYYQQQPVLYSNTTDATANTVTSYQGLDNVDVGIFGRATTNNSAPFSEILPSYCPTNSTSALETASTEYHHTMSYTSTYLSYPHNQHTEENLSYMTQPKQGSSNIGNTNRIVENNFSSCSVPSQPPYGTATTCNSTTTTLTSNDNSFISLTSPSASSSRLSQINDLLQHTRNTAAALPVAVSQHENTANICADSNSNLNSSIETPPINESQKGCFVFGSEYGRPSPQSEPPPVAAATTPTIDYDTCVAVADYTT